MELKTSTLSTPLKRLCRLVENAADTAQLKTEFVKAATTHFAACRGALFLFDELPSQAPLASIQANPVARYILERHAPVHEGIVTEPRQWEAFCQRNDHGHVMAGPIVREGHLLGALAFTRTRDAEPFEADQLSDMSALCLHLSIWFARWSQEETTSVALTPRERQIVDLVARGQTNSQIGQQLCVSSETVKAALKRIFRKTGVHSRTQLANYTHR